MAIQMRRGIYDKLDPTRLVAGEYAVVLSGDEIARDGRAVYMCFAAGTVKRLATHEDMYDFLLTARDDTIEYIETVATEDVRALYEALTRQLESDEAQRISNEGERVSEEVERITSESARCTAETSRQEAENDRNAYYEDIQQMVSDGDFNGATFTPAVNSDGVLSWTNDGGLTNPTSVVIKGEKGNDGVVTTLQGGMYALEIEGDGHLYLVYGDDADIPDLEIDQDGHLTLTIGESNA